MRWDALFSDLEAQLAAADAAELRLEVDDRSRAEVGAIALADRVRAHVGTRLTLSLRDGSHVQGTCAQAAHEWVVLAEGPQQALVPWAAVTTVSGLSRAAAPTPGRVAGRLGLRHALRALARDRSPIRLQVDGAELTGTVDRVGADHLDLAEHPLDQPRRADQVHGVRVVRLDAVLCVRSR